MICNLCHSIIEEFIKWDFRKVLGEEVLVVTDPEAIHFIPKGAIYYLPEEIQNLRGATPEEIQAVHRVKKEVGGKLFATKEKRGE